MILYHGTDQKIDTIDFAKSRLRTDFGRGFYLSDKLGNAQAWAIDKSGILGIAIVLCYEIDDAILNDFKIKTLRFDKPSVD